MLKIKSNFKTENTIDNMTGVHNPMLELTYVCAFLKKKTPLMMHLSFPFLQCQFMEVKLFT